MRKILLPPTVRVVLLPHDGKEVVGDVYDAEAALVLMGLWFSSKSWMKSCPVERLYLT